MSLLALWMSVAVAAERPAHPTAANLLGGSEVEHWDAAVSAGFPWLSARAQVGLPGGWTPLVEVQSALATRWQPAAGVGLRWVDRRWRVTGEALAGWLFQSGVLARKGPSAELRIKAGRAVGVLQPYAHAGTRHTLLWTKTTVDTVAGAEVSWQAGHEWTLTGGLGLGIAAGPSWGLDLGLDLPWVGVPTVSIPGVHLGAQFGGGR